MPAGKIDVLLVGAGERGCYLAHNLHCSGAFKVLFRGGNPFRQYIWHRSAGWSTRFHAPALVSARLCRRASAKRAALQVEPRCWSPVEFFRCCCCLIRMGTNSQAAVLWRFACPAPAGGDFHTRGRELSAHFDRRSCATSHTSRCAEAPASSRRRSCP